MLNKLRNEEGFTLIELLVVIIIIGVLAAIALPIFLNQQKAAADAVLKQDMKTVSSSVLTWLTKGKKISDMQFLESTGFDYVMVVNDEPGVGNRWLMSGSKGLNGEPVPSVSKGTKIGVKVTDSGTGYCIAGMNYAGTYDGGSSTNSINPNVFLYYDSAVGKVQTRTQLSVNGGCSYFAQ